MSDYPAVTIHNEISSAVQLNHLSGNPHTGPATTAATRVIRNLCYVLMLMVMLGGMDADAQNPACSQVAPLRAQIANYHAEYNRLTGNKYGGLRQQLKAKIIAADQQLAALIKQCAAPFITSFTPATSWPGGTVTITGTGFISTNPPANTTVSFAGNVTAPAASGVTATTLTVTIPQGAQSGPVVVNAQGSSVPSANPLNVLTQTVPASGSATLGSIFGSGNLLVAAGQNGTIRTSSNGRTWSTASCAGQTSNLIALGYAGVYIVGTGSIDGSSYLCRSSNGTNWSAEPVQNWALQSFVSQNNTVVVLSQPPSRIATTTNGTTFSEVATARDGDVLTGLVYNGQQYLALGQTSNAYISPDGVNWSPTALEGRRNFSSFVWSGPLQMYAGVDNGRVVTSPDGVMWTPRGMANGLQAIAWNGSLGLFMAVGGVNQPLVSRDGVNWSVANFAPTPGLQAITAYNNQFIAVGADGVIARFATQ